MPSCQPNGAQVHVALKSSFDIYYVCVIVICVLLLLCLDIKIREVVRGSVWRSVDVGMWQLGDLPAWEWEWPK